jgi:2-alkyl-3-oxoalkanoate reductase
LRGATRKASDAPVERRRILVTGAAGLIGSHLCESFAAAGWEVRALDRPGAECAEARAAGATIIAADLETSEGALLAAFEARGADLVAHASFPPNGETQAAVASARAAIAAAVSAQAPLLLLSSCAVYGRPRNLPCEEGELKAPVDPHGEARWAVEREAFYSRRTRGLQLVVLRPALTYGPRQRRGLAAALLLATLSARAGRRVWLPRRGPIVHPVHAVDVAQAALLIAEHGVAALDGRAFNVADDVPLPLEELARAVLHAAGTLEAGRLPYSPAPARLFLWVLRRLPAWIFWAPLNRRISRRWFAAFRGRPPVPAPQLTPDLLEQLAADRYFDTQRLRALGFVARFPSAVEGLSRLAFESRSRGLLPSPSTQAEDASAA